jgi:molybdopterin/thiamine biosynthesis adenylyltransferase
MSALKFANPDHWSQIEAHLAGALGERFAFAYTRQRVAGEEGPILEVVGIELIDDDDVEDDPSGWSITDQALDRVHNTAVRARCGLVEFHNHRVGPPGFSPTDRAGLGPMAEYVTSLLGGRVYAAGVYAVGRVHVEYWEPTVGGLRHDTFRSVIVLGDHLRLINAAPARRRDRLVRQTALLGDAGSNTLARLRVAIVGAGGTGSHAGQGLVHLGVSDLFVLDDDHVEETNLNRLVTASHADVGAPKNLVARRRMREVDPGVEVTALPALTPTGAHAELYDVDLIIGCVDHDGPRDRLNRIALDTATPYFDIATGIDPTSRPHAGGRIVLIIPGGACLHCLGELDPAEVGRWAKTDEQQTLDRAHGYGTTQPDPAVVHLNGIAVYSALAEFVAWIAGHRPPAQWLDIDLSGNMARSGSPSGTRVIPRHAAARNPTCVACGSRGG